MSAKPDNKSGKKPFGRLKKSLVAVFAIVAGAIYLEGTGYRLFDNKEGDNFLCNIDPTCRVLTENEISGVKKVFGDQIDYKSVKIFNRPNYVSSPIAALFSFNASAQAPNGSIYFYKGQDKNKDMAKSKTNFNTLMHEMTHVWQHHTGENLLMHVINEYIKHDYDYNKAYSYDIDDPTPFLELGIEQQAEIVEAYVNKVIGFEGSNLRMIWRGHHCEQVKKLEDKLKPALPIESLEACTPKAK